MGPDLEEFLWTYEDNLTYYPAEVQKLANEALSLFKEKLKSIESETSKSKPKSG
jgi:predicted transcriptional regulator